MGARNILFDKRYCVRHAGPIKRIVIVSDGRLIKGHADQSRSKSGRLFRLRLRLLALRRAAA